MPDFKVVVKVADFKRLFSDRTWRVIALAALGFSTLALFMTVGSDTTKCAFAAAGTCPAGDTRTFARALQINTDGADDDTIISGDTITNLLFADASTDRIGIGTSTPSALLHVAGALTVDGTLTLTSALPVASGGTGAATAAGARTNLGLGTMATQNASAVAITGGTIGPFTLSGLLSGDNQSITGVNNLTATSSTLGTLAVTSIGAHSLTGAITAGNQSITGVNSLTATSSTIGTLSLTNPLTVANGGTGNTTFTAYSVITAGTTATGPFQNVSGVGTSGQVLTSNGAGALPTWQTAAAGGGTFPNDGWFNATSTWTYSSADSPVFVISTAADESQAATGTRVKLTQVTGGTKYGIVVARTSSTLTVYMGTDYTLANEAISSPQVSPVRFPAGFPADPIKWQVLVTDHTNRSQSSPVAGTWYQLGSTARQISIPIGAWDVMFESDINVTGGCSPADGSVALSTSASSASDSDLNVASLDQVDPMHQNVTLRKNLVLTSKTLYYMTYKTDVSGCTVLRSVNFGAIIRAASSFF